MDVCIVAIINPNDKVSSIQYEYVYVPLKIQSMPNRQQIMKNCSISTKIIHPSIIPTLAIIFLCQIIQTSSALYAQSKLTNYEPLTFQLCFTEAINRPKFQILVNNNNLSYIFLSNSTFNSQYYMQVTSDVSSIDPDNTESYSIVFNEPLNVGNGTLFVGNYLLIPQKINYVFEMSNWPAILVFWSAIVASLFGSVGIWFMDFIQIYVLVEAKFTHQTTLIQILRDQLLFDNSSTLTAEQYTFRMIGPVFLMYGIFILTVALKAIFKKIDNKNLQKRLIKNLSYNVFLTAWTILLPSMIYKVIQHSQNHINNTVPNLSSLRKVSCDLFTYFNIVAILTHFYTVYFIVNPKPKQTESEYYAYLKSDQFNLYEKVHRCLHVKTWFKRNLFLFLRVRMLIVIILFFLVNDISIYVLVLQALHLFFIFTVRPYKQELYTNLSIAFNLILLFFYIIVIEGVFYYDLTPILQTSDSMGTFLLTKNAIFLSICFLAVVFTILEGYRNFSNLRYELTQEKEMEKTPSETKYNRNRLYTSTSAEKKLDMKESLIFDSPPSQSPTKLNLNLKQPKNAPKGKLQLFEVEMEDMSSPSLTRRRAASSARITNKWKDKSLFEELAN